MTWTSCPVRREPLGLTMRPCDRCLHWSSVADGVQVLSRRARSDKNLCHRQSFRPSGRRFKIASTIVSGSTMRPGPCLRQLSQPEAGPSNSTPSARSCCHIALDGGLFHMALFMAGAMMTDKSAPNRSVASKSSAKPQRATGKNTGRGWCNPPQVGFVGQFDMGSQGYTLIVAIAYRGTTSQRGQRRCTLNCSAPAVMTQSI